MARQARPAEIRATFSVEGNAREVLSEARKVRGGSRRASITLRLRGADGMRLPEDYNLPVIEGGKAATALGLVRNLCSQGRMSLKDRDEIIDLIEQFQDIT